MPKTLSARRLRTTVRARHATKETIKIVALAAVASELRRGSDR